MKKILLIVLLLITFGCKTKQVVTTTKIDSIIKIDSVVKLEGKKSVIFKVNDWKYINSKDSLNIYTIKYEYEYINGDTSKIKSKTITTTTNKTISTITKENKSLKEIKSDSTFKYSLKYLKEKIIKAKKEVKETPVLWKTICYIISIVSILGIIYFIIFKL